MEEQTRTSAEVTPEEVRDMIARREDFILVDIRNNSAYRRSHLKGAETLPFGATQPRDYERFIPDKDEKIVVYCYNGKASKVVADHLAEMGYTDVRSMAGGHWKWRFLSGAKPNVKGKYPLGKTK